MGNLARELLMGGGATPENTPPPDPERSYRARQLTNPTTTADPATAEALRRQQAGGMLLKDLPLANKDSDAGTIDVDTMSRMEAVDDQATKVRIIAQKLFPQLPPDEAAARIGYVEGEPIYLGLDDKIYRARPSGLLGAAKKAFSYVTGNLYPIAGATLGALSAPVSGPVGPIVFGSLGGMAGQGARKAEGVILQGEPAKSREEYMADIGQEGALDLAGGTVGFLLAKWLNRNVAKDIGRLNTAKSDELGRKAKDWGVDLTPAEQTNLPSLKAQQKAVGKMPQSADKMDEFLQRRPGQIDSALNRFLDTISPEDSVELAGRRVKEAAADTTKRLIDERAAAAEPIYNRAYDEFKGIPAEKMPLVQSIRDRIAPLGIEAEAVKRAKVAGIDLSDPAQSLRGMHWIKRALDGKIASAEATGDWDWARILKGAKNDLLPLMDEISPKDEQGRSLYKLARGIYAANSPQVERAQEGLIGRIANTAEEREINIPRQLFDPQNGPIAVSRIMNQLRKTDPDAADQALRAFLQTKWAEALGAARDKSMAGARFHDKVLRDPRQAEMLKAVMTGKQWGVFNDLMEVIEATGRAPMAGSDTAWNLEARKLIDQQAGGYLAKAAQLLSPQDVGNRVREFLKTRSVEEYVNNVADVITSPDAMSRMKELKALPVGSQVRLIKTAQLLGISLAPRDAAPEDRPIGQ